MLRVGIVLDSLEPGAWIASAVERIQASPFARIELVLLGRPRTGQSGGSLFRAYEAWDYGRNRVDADALEPVSVAHTLESVPQVQSPVPQKAIAETAARIRDLDVLLDFGAGPLEESWPEGPRHGIWRPQSELDFSGQHGRKRSWEALERNGTCASSVHLIRRAEDRVLLRSATRLDRTSLYRSRNPVLWKHAELVLRALARLAAEGRVPAAAGETSERAYRQPTNLETAFYLGRYARRWLSKKMQHGGERPANEWYIAIRPRTEGRSFDDPAGYRLMPCLEDRFYADPFLFERQGRTFLFFEDFRYPEGRAVISCCELDENGTPGELLEVLRRPYHLSYPLVFEDAGEIYMVPESRSNRTVELYRATDFPRKWEQEGPLLQDVDAVDATILRKDGKYWMFAGISDGRFSNSDEVSLFFAGSLKGPWKPHPMNPLVSDVRRARPAGKLFLEGGRLIRPSQDCSLAYGYALVFSEVTKMSETEYEERVISRIEPSAFPGGVGNHTYNRTERFEVTDRTLPRDTALLPAAKSLR